MRRLLLLAALLFAVPAHAVTIDWVTVGDPGNAPDTEVMTGGASDGTTGYGSVGYTYWIGKYEVTNAQYAEFLSAVAKDDTYGLYNATMASVADWGGITRSGSSGSYTYSGISGREKMPVNHVSFLDGFRFANWLHNGQPTGAQDNTTTEDGAYDMSLGANAVRKVGASIFLPSEDEWYKAAYYDAVSTSYFDYPAGSDTQTTCAVSGPTANTANCDRVVGDLTDVGSHTGSASPYGTFDQGGNIYEWTDTAFTVTGSFRVVRGGYFYGDPTGLAAWARHEYHWHVENRTFGFRVAMIPEPFTALLLATGLAGLAAARRWRSLP